MRLLLDTCTFLWLTIEPKRVPKRVTEVFRDGETAAFLSIASAWEIAIKHKLGRLDLPLPPSRYIPERIAQYGLDVLDIRLPHVTEAGSLPLYHNDPFDRLLIAQAGCEGLTVATPDPSFGPYDVRTMW
ncbi:MAG TPA: type II toxin-antitoxin system VapC family toxin [Alphaproteobacteria bacterium]|nr:type II toxin-antitoxin system VapC family toxin [Alphaproteobacteria bacterium]